MSWGNIFYMQGFVARFASNGPLWAWAVSCAAELDALMSLAMHATGSETTMCRPQILPYRCPGRQPPAQGSELEAGEEVKERLIFEATGLMHPAGKSDILALARV